ncbi:MAG: RluA family pseudouridine synthase [Clostridia bacterium]
MTRILEYFIENTDDEQTIERFLRKNQYQSKIISLLKRTENGITVNGVLAFTTHKLKIGETLLIKILDEKPSENIVPRDIFVDIVFEDDDILVINKQAFVPVHPSQGHFEDSLANGLSKYFLGKDFTFRCINRLDRQTSGLLIVAKNKLSASILSNMVANNEIKREYLAICKGDISPDFGRINASIARVFDSTIERVVDFERGQTAITNYKKIQFKNNHSLISLNLETGRTHQIRVHLKHINFPLIGDFLYNPDCSMIERQALHSHKLSFLHPITKNNMTFTQELPNDMAKIFT